MKQLPIRIRLSLWYFAMFASAALLLSLISIWMLRRSVDSTEYHELQERADDVQHVLQHQDTNLSPEAVQHDLTAIYEFKDDGKYLQIRDADGHWIYRSRRMIEADPALPPLHDIPPAGIQTEFHQGARFVRVLAYAISAHGKSYSVQTGISLNKSVALLLAFRNGLLLLTPAVILLAALGGHWMSRKALQPIAALAAQARLINDRNLDTRLPVSDTSDEISDLSNTLNQMLARIDKAFASTRAFTGNASHELRTPIALLRAEIDVALFRPRTSEEYRSTLTRLSEEALRMTSLVENLLSLARADGGADAMSLTPVHVTTLFRTACRTWEPTMRNALLDLRTDTPDDELVLLGDAHGLQRLLSILLENASKFTPPGGLVTLIAAPSGSRIVISVRDTGIGISEEDMPRIFERFYRAAHPSNTPPRGSGLGLALAKWLAESHGTQLTVASQPGNGSTFSISLERIATPDLPRNAARETVIHQRAG